MLKRHTRRCKEVSPWFSSATVSGKAGKVIEQGGHLMQMFQRVQPFCRPSAERTSHLAVLTDAVNKVRRAIRNKLDLTRKSTHGLL
jgi:hypothetical protein